MASDPTRLSLSATRRTQPPPPIITTTFPSGSIVFPIRAPLSSDDHDDSDAGILTSDDDDGFETASDAGEPSPDPALTVRDSPGIPLRVAARPAARISFDDDDGGSEEEVFEEGLAEEVDGEFPLADQDSSLTDEGEVLDGVDDGSVEESKDAVLPENASVTGVGGAQRDSLVVSGAGAVDGDEERGVVDVQGEKVEDLNNGSEVVGQKEASETGNSPGSSIVDEVADAAFVNPVVLDARDAKDEHLDDGVEELGVIVEQKEASEPENSPGSSIVGEIIADDEPVNSAVLNVLDEKYEHLDDGFEEVGGLVVEQQPSEPENPDGSAIMNGIAAGAEPAKSAASDAQGEKDEHLNDGPEEAGGLAGEQTQATETEISPGSLVMNEVADTKIANSAFDARDEEVYHLDGSEGGGGISEPESSPAISIIAENVGAQLEDSAVSVPVLMDGDEENEVLHVQENLVSEKARGPLVEDALNLKLREVDCIKEENDRTVNAADSNENCLGAKELKHDGVGANALGAVEVEKDGVADASNLNGNLVVAEEPKHDGVADASNLNEDLVVAEEPKHDEVADASNLNGDLVVAEEPTHDGVADASNLNGNLVVAEEPKHDGVADASNLNDDLVAVEEPKHDGVADASDLNDNLVVAEEPKHDGVADASDLNENLVAEEEPKHIGVTDASDLNDNLVAEEEPKHDGDRDASDLNDNLVAEEEPKHDGVADASDLTENLVAAEEPKHDGVADASDSNDYLVAEEEPKHDGVADASDLKENIVAAEEPKHDGVEADVLDAEEIGVSWGSNSFQIMESSAEGSHTFTNCGSIDDAGVARNTESLDKSSVAVNLEITDGPVDKLDAVCESEGVGRSASLIQDIGEETGDDPEQASKLKAEPDNFENPELADDTVNKVGPVPASECLEGGFDSVNPEIVDGSLDKLDAVCVSEAVDRSAFLIQDGVYSVDRVGANPEQALNFKAESYVSENLGSADDTVNKVDAVHASEAVDRSDLLIQGIGDEKVGADSRQLVLKTEPNVSETKFAVGGGDLLLVPEVESQPILIHEFKGSETEEQVSETSVVVKEEESSVISNETPTPGCISGLEEKIAADASYMADDDNKEDPKAVEEEQEGLVSKQHSRVAILESSEAAKQIIKELVEGSSSASTYSVFGSSYHHSGGMDGQFASDSEEEMDNDEEGEGKELFDSAALAALLRAATSTSSDGTVTITPADAARIFSIDRPAGLGSSVPSLKPASARSTRPNIFTPSDLEVASEPDNMNEEQRKLHDKVELIRVKFLRLVQRLGHSPEDTVAAQVLYRLGLAERLKHGRQASRAFSFDNARKKALELEVNVKEDLDFSCNILVIGKTGVGKSATVNSIFGAEKSRTNAFHCATTSVKEIVGVVQGVKIRVIDTPGLRSSVMDQASNKKILSSIKKYTKRCPPDIVLYVDRMDTQTRDFNDLPLLKSITSALGSSIWFNAIVALTHADSAPPEGPNGFPLSYDVFEAQRSHVVHHSIRQAAGDTRLTNPVALVENHPSCRRNRDGERVLPNGLSWRPQMLLLCFSSKILSEANSLLKVQEPSSGKLFGFRTRSPPLAYLLSSLLQPRSHPKLSADQGGDNGDSDIDLDDLFDSDQEEVDEYDDLPPFKPLRKSQLVKLTKEQRSAYFDEYDYRVKLLQKKHWKQELRRLKEMKQHVKGTQEEFRYGDTADDFEQDNVPASVPVPMPDMALPPSFDCEHPVHRYRFLEPTSQLLARPVLDSHGWDHDCGYDGVSIEHALGVAGRFPSGTSVQITKDKKEFSIHLDSSVAAKHGETGSTLVGFDIQSIGKQLAYFFRGETKFKNLKKNKTTAGISVTLLGETVATGLKVEDELSVGKRVGLVASTGAVRSEGDLAYGANLEARLRDKDYPLGQSLSTLGLSLLRWRGETALGANLQSQISIGRNSKMAVRVGLNNKMSGQITIRTSSSEHLQIALMGILPIVMSIYRSIFPGESIPY